MRGLKLNSGNTGNNWSLKRKTVTTPSTLVAIVEIISSNFNAMISGGNGKYIDTAIHNFPYLSIPLSSHIRRLIIQLARSEIFNDRSNRKSNTD